MTHPVTLYTTLNPAIKAKVSEVSRMCDSVASTLVRDPRTRQIGVAIAGCMNSITEYVSQDPDGRLRYSWFPTYACGKRTCPGCKGRNWRTNRHVVPAFQQMMRDQRQSGVAVDLHCPTFSPKPVNPKRIGQRIDTLHTGVRKMLNSDPLKHSVIGYRKQIEITRRADGNANVHLHLLYVTQRDTVPAAAKKQLAIFKRCSGLRTVTCDLPHAGITEDDWALYVSKPKVHHTLASTQDADYTLQLALQLEGRRLSYNGGREFCDRISAQERKAEISQRRKASEPAHFAQRCTIHQRFAH